MLISADYRRDCELNLINFRGEEDAAGWQPNDAIVFVRQRERRKQK